MFCPVIDIFICLQLCDQVCEFFGVTKADRYVSVVSAHHDRSFSSDIRKGISMERLQRYGLQLCSAVANLHQNGIIFGDLNPETILIDGSDNCLLIDIGKSLLVVKRRFIRTYGIPLCRNHNS